MVRLNMQIFPEARRDALAAFEALTTYQAHCQQCIPLQHLPNSTKALTLEYLVDIYGCGFVKSTLCHNLSTANHVLHP